MAATGPAASTRAVIGRTPQRPGAATNPGIIGDQSAPLPPLGRHARGLSRAGHRKAPGAASSALLWHMESGAVVEQLRAATAWCCPTCRYMATPRTIRAIPTRSTGTRASRRVRGRRARSGAVIGGHGMGADVALRAVQGGLLRPRRLVLMSSSLHARPECRRARAAWRACFMAGAVAGLDRLAGYGAARLSPQRAA